MATIKRITSLFLMMALVTMTGVMTSCNDDDVKGWSDLPASGWFTDDDNGVLYDYEAYLSGAIETEMLTALNECVVNKSSGVEDDTKLVVLGSFEDLDYASLEKAYNNGATIAIVTPSQSDFDAFFAAHPDWAGYTNGIDLDGSLLYSFDKDGSDFLILDENDPNYMEAQESTPVEETQVDGKGVQDLAKFNDKHDDVYGYIGPWLTNLNRCQRMQSPSPSRSPSTNTGSDPIEKFAKCYHHGRSYPFSSEKKVRQLLFSDPDVINGSGTITVCYDVYQVHVYEGEAGAGDYYLVDMFASVANKDMFKGKWWNRHGGCYVRMTGFYCKSFNISSELVSSDGTVVNVRFPANASPTPSTTNGSTQYTNSTSLNLGASTSLSAGVGLSSDGPTVNASRNLGMSLGWNWTKSDTRNVSDVDISNRSSGSKTAWSVIFNNLPYFDWNEEYGFNLGKAQAYRSTQDIHASWAWYEPYARDDEDKLPYRIKFTASADYGSMDFLTTKADLNTHDWTFGALHDSFLLDKIANGRAGRLILNNDFTDQYISNIKVYDADKPENVFYLNKNSFEPRTQIALGAYLLKINGKTVNYMISFDANKAGLPPKSYKYTLNPYIPVLFKQTTTINAKNDCSIVQ